jgi:hypothetical protein
MIEFFIEYRNPHTLGGRDVTNAPLTACLIEIERIVLGGYTLSRSVARVRLSSALAATSVFVRR